MDLSSWMRDTITVESTPGVDVYGQAIPGKKRQVKCRLEHKLQKVVDASGQEIMSNHEIATLQNISLLDRIWLPGSDTKDATQARTPHNVAVATDKFGHTTLWMVFL